MSKVSIKGKEKALPAVAKPDTDMIGSVEIVEEIPQPFSVANGGGESSKSPPTASKPSENATSKYVTKFTSQPKAATKAECSPEQRLIFEAEQRRAAAISGVEATSLPLTNGSSR
ncbi:EKA-like protein [Blumeria hordei DH14]|uniref:EKA-like protein n=1 Tax=Blumeria graminis f. sp. hordei (strain DH14) TaxID=546991 RepID=N1JHP7_BLUG1|nr:EKA-like protein [Blumeria hordei DH14]